MALTPTDNQAFLREVDDDLRRDQVTGFAKRWGKVVGVAVVVGLVVLAAFLFWQHRRATRAGEQGEQLVGVIDDATSGRASATDPRLAELAQAPGDGYQSMARIMQANLEARTNPTQAAASFKAIANDAGLPQPTRDLAMLRATTLEFDRIAPAEVIARLKGLAQPGSPWFGSAAELTALAHLKMNQPKPAAALFARIAADDKAPGTLRGRAASMATSLGQPVATPKGLTGVQS
ncbi:tetratricopeptide repeat protein [uncultured Sphingomonas sp.]|uniref:tetratricopeptide repeat protein n=1 Tax=uncultured Sphingomonas sp. TaxID=158754 RepID=UPI0025F7C119|nr:tetratricopeptide repeat protein [uncultured Sphingomonas sp.]